MPGASSWPKGGSGSTSEGMARDDTPDPGRRPTPPTLGPREMRARLSSSLGIQPGQRRGERRDRIEPAPPAIDPPYEPPYESPDEPTPGPAYEPAYDPSFEPAWEPEPPDVPTVDEPIVHAPEPRVRTAARTVPVRSEPEPERGGRRPRREEGHPTGKRTIVPPQAVAGSALISVVAIMCFLVCLAVGALAMVAEAARDWQIDVSREVTIQVKPIDGTAIDLRLAKALEIARATTGVRSARLVDERESAALLEPWLGKGLDLGQLPVPRLVVLELADPATADLAGLTRRIGTEVDGAVVDDHAVWAARLRTMAGAVVVVGAGVVVLMLAAMMLSVVFATRAAMAGNRDVIEVLHFVGAEDTFIAREFQRHFLVLGLEGGIGGGAAAMICFFLADRLTRAGRGDALIDQVHALFGGVSVGLLGHLGVIAVVGVVALLTAVTSRATVLGHLRRLD